MTATKPRLAIVRDEPLPTTHLGPDYATIRQRDWAAVHISGDRSEPLYIPDRIKRIWR